MCAYCVCAQVYPRVCGGTTAIITSCPNMPGLSPRVRGNPARRALPAALDGSIPACAGEPCRPATALRTRQVYPRVCGGTSSEHGIASRSTGLSPRVRGNPSCLCYPAIRYRSIPACAGEPAEWLHSVGYAEVYPRVCGGTNDHPDPDRDGRRLSPRVRGNRPGPAPSRI